MNNKTLSIFVDESGILSEQDGSSRFYVLTLVLHDQSLGIEETSGVGPLEMCDF